MLYIPYYGPQKPTLSAWLCASQIWKLAFIELAIVVAVLGTATRSTQALAVSVDEPLPAEVAVTERPAMTDPNFEGKWHSRCRRPIVPPRDCFAPRRLWPCCAPGGSASSAAAGGNPTQGEVVASSRSSAAAGGAAGAGGGGGGSGAASPSSLSFGSFTDPIIASSPVNPVPGPLAGSGLPALVFGFLTMWWWRRRTAHAFTRQFDRLTTSPTRGG